MDYSDVQREFDLLDYWDMQVLDFTIHYFGDEVTMVIAAGETTNDQMCHVVKFLQCYSVTYQTDADNAWRDENPVHSMNRRQLGHYLQDISVIESSVNGFLEIHISTGLLTATIHCKRVQIERRAVPASRFFGKN